MFLILTFGLLFCEFSVPNKVDWTIMTMIRASVIAEQTTSQDLMSHCFGKAGEIVINCAFIFNCMQLITANN